MNYTYENGLRWKDKLDLAQFYAERTSGCNKVIVGSVIVKDNQILAVGANKCIPNLCRVRGCLRVERFGDDSKKHRNPGDCRAIHSEVDAISSAAKQGIRLDGATIYVTRYPCESCAKAIIAAGISSVVYGGTTLISNDTEEMFNSYGVEFIHSSKWKSDTTDR